ncbi:hypothetical protein QN277_010546 [Acacia crassicarpa]|uniref:GAG-pre-integrase domain-containing protein n=1 Tax=Acacia crassicarpa TaxID=499986 RepID=A0AAE1IN30_9FABA|nr:hypothetical protein QN277_010546 [Acacia crassicarpa]
MAIKNELHNSRKSSMKTEDYLSKIKKFSDELALASSSVATDDFILHTLNGLDFEYNAIVVKLVDQPDLSKVDAQSALLSFENRLNQLNHFSGLTIQPSINYTQHYHEPNSDSGSNRGGRNHGGRSHKGGGSGRVRGGRRGGGGRPFCVNCQRPGHTIATCYYRNDSSGFSHFQSPQAFYANSSIFTNPSWYMDSGANYHVTPNSEQLEDVTPVGTFYITTCTRQPSSIAGIGSVTIPCNQSQLILKTVLHVPSATKNLINVNHLIVDNPVCVEFTDSWCDVKDMKTSKSLLRGILKEGMYPMNARRIDTVPQACMATHDATPEDFAYWHHVLSHPSIRVLKQILPNCNKKLSNVTLSDRLICEACQLGKSKCLPFSILVSHSSSPLKLIHTDL